MRKLSQRIPAFVLTSALLASGLLATGAAPVLALTPPVESTAVASAAATTEATKEASTMATAEAKPSATPSVEPTVSPNPRSTPVPTETRPPVEEPAEPAVGESETPVQPSAPATAEAKPTMEPTGSVATPSDPAPAPKMSQRSLAVPNSAAAPSDTITAQILAAINRYRIANGAKALIWNSTISKGSQQWATTLNTRINNGTLDSNNTMTWHRPDAGFSILPPYPDMYSEIISVNNTPQQMVDWWMTSPSHRAALMNKRATDIGIGHVKTTKSGWYGMRLAVANLAGYESSRADPPTTKPTVKPSAKPTVKPSAKPTTPPPVPTAPPTKDGDIAAIDSAGNLFMYGSAKGGDVWQRKFISAGWAGTVQVELIDFNADGLQDVIAKRSNGQLVLSKGQKNGTFTAATQIGTGWGKLEILATKWRTSDKFGGIVAKNTVSGDLLYYSSSNGSSLNAGIKIGNGWGGLTLMAVDYDLDGRMDIAARNAAGQLLLYRGAGTGGFKAEARKVIGTGWGAMTHISGIRNHLGSNAWGVLARDRAGNILHYQLLKGGFGSKAQIGTGGWQTMKLGS